MRLSIRAQQLAASATVQVTSRVAALKEAGRDVMDFGVGEPDFPSPAVAVEAAREALASGFTKYTVSSGIPDLRDALAEHYQRRHGSPWERPNVVVTVGAKAALFQIFQILVDEGSEVVLPTPDWVSFREQVRLAGGTPVPVLTHAAEDFEIRAAPLIAAMGERTRAVLVNSPCNPTGGIMPARELRQLVVACAERGVVVVADETYERLIYDGQEHASVAALAAEFPETVVVVGSFSKTYAMTGWRLGYLLAHSTLAGKVSAVQSHMTSNPTSFAMPGALAALRGAEAEVRAMVEEFEWRRNRLISRLRALPGVVIGKPAGAFYAFPDVGEACERVLGAEHGGSLAFAEMLLERAGLAVVPGIAFGADRHIRLSFACSRESLAEGMDRLEEALGGGA